MSNYCTSNHTPVGGGGVSLKGMDVPAVNHPREGSILGQEMRALTSSPKNEVRKKLSSLSLNPGVVGLIRTLGQGAA